MAFVAFAATVPLPDSGTGAVGTSDKAAREDHVHPAVYNTAYGPVRIVSTAQTLLTTDGAIRVPAGNAAITLTFPASPPNGQAILCDNLSSNAVTFSPASGQTVIQPNSNASTATYQVGGGVRETFVFDTTYKIWKAG